MTLPPLVAFYADMLVRESGSLATALEALATVATARAATTTDEVQAEEWEQAAGNLLQAAKGARV